MTKRTSWLAVALALVLVLGGVGQPSVRADTIMIDDLTDGTPIVTAGNQAAVTILASGPEFVHFTYASSQTVTGSVLSGTVDLLEPGTGAFSDRLTITAVDGSNIFDVQFASDPALLPGSPDGTATENGNFQPLIGFSQGGVLIDTYQVRSDVTETGTEPVPGPGSFVLLGLGALGLIGYGWRRRKQ